MTIMREINLLSCDPITHYIMWPLKNQVKKF
jgi:hypothetical protein